MAPAEMRLASGWSQAQAALPADSLAFRALECVDYLDVYAIRVDTEATLEGVAQRLFGGRPSRLMRLRDALVRPWGLKTSPRWPQPRPSFVRGERIGLFTLFERTPWELLLGEDDRHLDFRICLRVSDGRAVLATLVHFRNAWGRAYFFLVRPFHTRIVKRMLRRARPLPRESSSL